mgnify:CR=1 FL=1
MKYPSSSSGTKAEGTVRKSSQVARRLNANRPSISGRSVQGALEHPHVRAGPPVDDAVDAGEEPPVAVSCFSSSSADRAGVKVTALKTDSTTENAMVSENCW